MEEEKANANSEMRYIALELTKLAHRKKKSFRSVASEYVQNVYDLEGILRSIPAGAAQKSRQNGRQKAYNER